MKKHYTLFILSTLIVLCSLKAQQWDQVGQTTARLELIDYDYKYFGNAVAIDGDYAVVGSNGYNANQGCAYVLYNDGTKWDTVAFLTASDGELSDKFGYSVGISGDYVVIGANADDDNGTSSGSAYIFEKPAGGWYNTTETAKLTPSDGAQADNFGMSVSISGDYVLVGAPFDDDDGSSSGSAYIFEKPASGWTNINETAKLTASDAAEGDRFGFSISISADNIIIGAYENNNNGTATGSAYIFEKPASGWVDTTETAKLTPSDGSGGDYFGYSVSISGNDVVIGAYGEDDNGSSSGSAYIFEMPVSGWIDINETAKLTASDGAQMDYFGFSVNISGDQLIIGAKFDDDNDISSGAAYIYEKPASGWSSITETAKLTASDGTKSDGLGAAVAISDKYAIVGAIGDDDQGNDGGAVYLYENPSSGWSTATEDQKIVSPIVPNSKVNNYGTAVDIDGYFGVVGSPGYNGSTGCAYVISYNGTSWDTVSKLSPSDGEESDLFGVSVSISGNYIVVGANYNNDNGAAYVFKKPETGWTDMTETTKLTASDGAKNDYFGLSVSISGDIVVVGAYGNDENGSASGAAYVFEKPGTGWTDTTETAKLLASDGYASSYFGRSVSISDDQIIVGAYGHKITKAGAAYLFEKPSEGWTDTTETAKFTASDATANDYFGSSVDISDDNIVVGAWGDDDMGTNSGAAYVFKKPADGWTDTTETAKLTDSDGADYNYFGEAVSISGNYIIVGAYNYNNMGAAYIYEKPADGWADTTETLKISNPNNTANDYFGKAVAISGYNAIVGAKGTKIIWDRSGVAYQYHKRLDTVKISSNPESFSDLCAQSIIRFGIVQSGADSIQWQVSDNKGLSYTNITDNELYTGTTTDTLIVIADTSVNQHWYRCIAFNPDYSDTSDYAILALETIAPEITTMVTGDTLYLNSEGEAILPDYTELVTASDNCSSTIAIKQTPVAGNVYTSDSVAVTFTLSDEVGNISDSSFYVQILDTITPTITSYPEDKVVYKNESCGAVISDYTEEIVATDNFDATLTINQSPAADFEIVNELTVVTITVSDNSGNTTSVSFNITAKDTITPEINCISDQSIDLLSGETVYTISGNEFDPVTDDNCAVSSIINNFNNTASLNGSELPVGVTTIQWTVEDESGNTSVCSFDISVNQTTRVNLIDDIGIAVYPNPVSDVVNIELDENTGLETYSIYATNGKRIDTGVLKESMTAINVSFLDPGIYLLKIVMNKKALNFKIIKE